MPITGIERNPRANKSAADRATVELAKSKITMRLRRLKRSAMAPPNGDNKTPGTADTAKTKAKRSGLPVMSRM